MNQKPSSSDPQRGSTTPESERSSPSQRTDTTQRIPLKLPSATPLVTYSLIAVTVIAFLLQLGTDYLLGFDLLSLYGLKVNSYIANGQYWRLITPIILHGDVIHIAFNMYALYIIGPRIERYYGHWRFFALYVLSGFGGNVISMMFTEAPSLGASTATFGILGAYGIFFYQNRKVYGPAVRQALNRIITVLAINLVIGLSARIDNWGHVGGLAGGIIFAWMGGPILGVSGDYPDLNLADQRKTPDVVQAAIITFVFFGVLTAGAIYLLNQ